MLWSENLCSFPLTCLVFGARVGRGGERIYVSASLLCLLQPGQKGRSSTGQTLVSVSGGASLCRAAQIGLAVYY